MIVLYSLTAVWNPCHAKKRMPGGIRPLWKLGEWQKNELHPPLIVKAMIVMMRFFYG